MEVTYMYLDYTSKLSLNTEIEIYADGTKWERGFRDCKIKAENCEITVDGDKRILVAEDREIEFNKIVYDGEKMTVHTPGQTYKTYIYTDMKKTSLELEVVAMRNGFVLSELSSEQGIIKGMVIPNRTFNNYREWGRLECNFKQLALNFELNSSGSNTFMQLKMSRRDSVHLRINNDVIAGKKIQIVNTGMAKILDKALKLGEVIDLFAEEGEYIIEVTTIENEVIKKQIPFAAIADAVSYITGIEGEVASYYRRLVI